MNEEIERKMATAFNGAIPYEGVTITGMSRALQQDELAYEAFVAIHKHRQTRLSLLDFEERSKRSNTWQDIFLREEGRVR